MSRHAGFAMVACFTEKMVNRVLDTYFINLITPIQIPLPSSVEVGQQQVPITGTLAVLPPDVGLRSRPDNLVTAQVRAAGLVSVGGKPGGLPLQNFEAILTSVVKFGLVSLVVGDRLMVALDPSATTVDSVTFSLLSGQPLSPLASA